MQFEYQRKIENAILCNSGSSNRLNYLIEFVNALMWISPASNREAMKVISFAVLTKIEN